MKLHGKVQVNMQRICCLIVNIMLLLTCFTLQVSAEEKADNVIRVGAFEGSYNEVNERGERSGYGYEYIRDIAGYTGWSYEYIDSSWDECFSELEKGNIDIVGGISYTEERTEKMLFSDMPMGEERYYIYTDGTDEELSACNLSSFEGKNIGVLKGYIPEEVLITWEEKNGLHMNHIKSSSVEEVINQLSKKEIDCFVSVEEVRWANLNMAPITSIGESSIYFAINKNRPDIKESLDRAMRRIKDDNPFYTDDLYRRYLASQSSAILSKEEKDWINRHGAIKIGYLNNDTGVSVVNPETGKLTGVINDYVDIAKDCLQGQTLDFEVKGYDTRSQQLEALHKGEIDLIFHVSQNPYSAETNGFVLSDTIWSFNLAAITVSSSFDENAKNRVAVLGDNFALKAYISYNYPQWEIQDMETLEEALQAVKDGKADCVLRGSGTVADYLKDKRLHCVFLTKTADVSFGIKPGEPVLLSIMNKTLMSIPTEKFSGAVVYYSNAMRKVTIKDFIKDNLLIVVITVAVIFSFILLLILSFLQKSKKAESKAKKAARKATELNQKLEENKKELQRALLDAQSANIAKTSFLHNMSHDIRTPINGIIGMLTMIQKSKDNPEKVRECLGKIEESSNLLLSLVNDVLDMAKLESNVPIQNNESIELNQVCAEITETLAFQAEEAGISITGEHDDYIGIYVWSNELHLKKILMNLFSNSIKYNKPNGSVYMSMRTLERTENQIICEFKIRDTGIGMSEEFIKNELFEPFVQADHSARSSYTGTGLGMPIVKNLVEKMGGTISVESRLGEGSCFTVVLPFKLDHEAKKKTKNAVQQNLDISGIRVLLVEDNELNMEIAEFMLKDQGAQVDKAMNGKEAVRKFASSDAGTYDVILMDVMMPVMDGLTAAKTIRALDHPDAKSIPIIAMTANAFSEDKDKALEAGMNDHVAKPVSMDKLVATIVKFL